MIGDPMLIRIDDNLVATWLSLTIIIYGFMDCEAWYGVMDMLLGY